MRQSPCSNITFHERCQEIHTSHNYDEEAFKHSRLALSIKTAVQLLYLQAIKWASERICQDLFDGEGKRALDVGSAYGYAASMLHSLRYHAVALDISKYALRTGDKGNRIQGDAHNLPIKSDSINIITCFDTLEHLKKPIQLIRSSYRCLCQRGVLLIENPIANPIDAVSDKVHKMGEIHCSLLTASELTSLLLTTGFHTAKTTGLLPIPFQRFPVFGRFIEIQVPLSAARRILIAATKD